MEKNLICFKFAAKTKLFLRQKFEFSTLDYEIRKQRNILFKNFLQYIIKFYNI